MVSVMPAGHLPVLAVLIHLDPIDENVMSSLLLLVPACHQFLQPDGQPWLRLNSLTNNTTTVPEPIERLMGHEKDLIEKVLVMALGREAGASFDELCRVKTRKT